MLTKIEKFSWRKQDAGGENAIRILFCLYFSFPRKESGNKGMTHIKELANFNSMLVNFLLRTCAAPPSALAPRRATN